MGGRGGGAGRGTRDGTGCQSKGVLWAAPPIWQQVENCPGLCAGEPELNQMLRCNLHFVSSHVGAKRSRFGEQFKLLIPQAVFLAFLYNNTCIFDMSWCEREQNAASLLVFKDF